MSMAKPALLSHPSRPYSAIIGSLIATSDFQAQRPVHATRGPRRPLTTQERPVPVTFHLANLCLLTHEPQAALQPTQPIRFRSTLLELHTTTTSTLTTLFQYNLASPFLLLTVQPNARRT